MPSDTAITTNAANVRTRRRVECHIYERHDHLMLSPASLTTADRSPSPAARHLRYGQPVHEHRHCADRHIELFHRVRPPVHAYTQSGSGSPPPSTAPSRLLPSLVSAGTFTVRTQAAPLPPGKQRGSLPSAAPAPSPSRGSAIAAGSDSGLPRAALISGYGTIGKATRRRFTISNPVAQPSRPWAPTLAVNTSGLTNSGTVNVASGSGTGSLTVTGGLFTNNSAVNVGSGTNAGTLTANSGYTNASGGTTTLSSGTLNGSGTFSNAGALSGYGTISPALSTPAPSPPITPPR